MKFLQTFGFSTDEKGLEKIIIAKNQERFRNPFLERLLFSHTLPLEGFHHRLREFSRKFPDKNTHYDLSRKVESLHDLYSLMTGTMVGISNDRMIVSRRQNAFRFLADAYRGKNSRLIGHIIGASIAHNDLMKEYNSDPERKNLTDCVPYFGRLVFSLRTIVDELSASSEMTAFAEDIATLLNDQAIASKSSFFGPDGRLVLESSGWNTYAGFLIDRPVCEKRISREMLFEVESTLSLYPGSENDYEAMFKFVRASMPLVYSLGMLAFCARNIHQREKLCSPVCFAEFNEEGIFSVTDALPLATKISGGVPFDFSYTRDDRHVVFAGAHSGGKTHRLQDIGLYHLLGLSGFPLPASFANIPVINKLHSVSQEKSKENSAHGGSLENEIRSISTLASTLGPDDLILIDELLDTTKPEIARHLVSPILRILREKKSAIMVVYHGAEALDRDIGYRFINPGIDGVVNEDWRYVRQDFLLECLKTGGTIERYCPTYRFEEGIPDGKMTQLHARQMWEDLVLGRHSSFPISREEFDALKK